jgi:hypothetical protein
LSSSKTSISSSSIVGRGSSFTGTFVANPRRAARVRARYARSHSLPVLTLARARWRRRGVLGRGGRGIEVELGRGGGGVEVEVEAANISRGGGGGGARDETTASSSPTTSASVATRELVSEEG